MKIKITKFSLLLFISLIATSTFAEGINELNKAVENSRHLLPGETFTLDAPCQLFNNFDYKIYHCETMLAPLVLIKDKTLAATPRYDNLLHRQISFDHKEDGLAIFHLLPITNSQQK